MREEPPHYDPALLQQLTTSFKKRIPSGTVIASEAVQRALAGRQDEPDWIKANFSNLVQQVQIEAYRVYLGYEGDIGGRLISEVFSGLLPDEARAQDALELVSNHFGTLDRFFLSLTQGRRPRAGNAFELVLRELFTRLEYPYTSRPELDGSIPDFVLPSIEHYRANAMDAIVFTAKRTLRERWRQIVTEGTRGIGFFLATIDEKVSQRDLAEMMNSRIYLVVPIALKSARYRDVPNVITFELFFDHHLDPAMRRWREGGVI